MSRFLFSFLLFGLAALLTAASASAQAIRWEPLQGALAVGQTSELMLIFEDCSPSETPRIPKVDGLTLEFAGQSTSTSIINFTRSDSVTFTYAARLTKKQRVTIPSFEIETNKGKLRTPVANYEPGAATVGNTGVSLENAANSRLVAVPASVWAGEVFTLNYTLDAARSYFPDFGRGQIDWNAEPLVAEDWSRPEPLDFRAGAASEPRTGLAYHTRAIARTPGAVRLNAVSQLLNLSVGVTGFGFFQQRQYQQYSVTSAAPVLEVKPLPVAPAGFNGAVGDLKLTSKIVPLTAAIGEPITWTLELTGPANWPDIRGLPARAISKNFQVVSPQAKRTTAEGKLFDSTLTEDVVLVPSKPGPYTLGPVAFTYFDPKTGSYKTLTTPAATITITEAAAPTPAAGLDLSVTPDNAASAQSRIENQKSKILPAPAPAALPRDPLPGSVVASLPLSTRVVALWLALPVLALVLFWFWLALRRARETDPLLPRRAAYARLQKILAEMASASGSSVSGSELSALSSQLLRWQHDTALLLQIPSAAPTAADLPKLEAQNLKLESLSALPTLWREADAALYAAATPLPADWTSRAQSVLAATPLRRFSPLRLLLPRNLFPFVAALTLALFLAPPPLAAADAPSPLTQNLTPAAAASAYRKGDFAIAEKFYRTTLAAAPTDAIAHHNLSLALAQQDRWDEAAAHAAVALVQHPASEPIRAQFALAAEKSGHVPAPLAVFLTPGPVHTLARMNSPANWQGTLIFAVLGAAISLGFVLFHTYSRTASHSIYGAYGALVFSALLALSALVGWRAYGPVNDTRAAIAWRTGTLRSIPTEADTAQKTTPLAAGSLAFVDQSFLGWRHLTFPAGQSGWVRAEDLVAIWK
jgi:tetratricopeptide (TPR) repeat protein